MRNLNWLAKLKVRKWFAFVWWTLYFVYLVAVNVLVSYISYYLFGYDFVPWSVAWWIKCLAVGVSAYLVFFTWGDYLKRRGKNLIRGQEYGNNSH